MIQKNQYPTPVAKQLFQAILTLKNLKEAIKFFRDLLTLKEINDFSTRFQIAKLLNKKKFSYEQIAKKCQVSTTTVTRVAHWLTHGTGGYKSILNRLSHRKSK